MNIRRLKNFVVAKIKADVPDNLSYHGLHHTLDVLRVCNQYIKRLNIGKKDAYLLRTAALLHDLGTLWSYANHEERGIVYAKELLPQYGYSESDIEVVSGLIMATQLPQQPNNVLETIICDADLDYLGTDMFYITGETLYQEFKFYGVVKDEEDFDRLQVKFLSNHTYQTEFARKHREPVKRKFLKEILDKWGWDPI